MTKGGSRPWWQFPKAAADEMTYECDASLGSPSEADCSHIEWSELLPDSDSLHVGPGAVTFLHSSTPLFHSPLIFFSSFFTPKQKEIVPHPLLVHNHLPPSSLPSRYLLRRHLRRH